METGKIVQIVRHLTSTGLTRAGYSKLYSPWSFSKREHSECKAGVSYSISRCCSQKNLWGLNSNQNTNMLFKYTLLKVKSKCTLRIFIIKIFVTTECLFYGVYSIIKMVTLIVLSKTLSWGQCSLTSSIKMKKYLPLWS